MDTVNPQSFETPAQPKHPLKKLLLLEAGIFEIGFVVILLCLVFGFMNYFNVLSLSKIIPQLSFLPHIQKAPTDQTASNSNFVNPPKSDNVDGKIVLLSYIEQTVQPAYVPKNSTQQFTTTSDQIILTSIDTANNINFLARFVYEKDLKTIQIKRLSLQMPNTASTSALTAQNIHGITTALFSNAANLPWNCTSATICTAFISGTSQKKSFKLILGTASNTLNFSECEVTRGSSLFTTFTSCP